MSGQLFATKWHFLHSTVLVGIDRSTGVFSGREPSPGQQMVCVWTTMEIAEEALHVESWELREIAMRDLLAVVPAGIGVLVDPERPSGMTATATYIAQLRRFAGAFPADTEVRLSAWTGLPTAARGALLKAVAGDGLVSELHAFTYTIDDSPLLGCLAHEPAEGVDAATVASALDSVLSSSTDRAELGVPVVNILALDDLPDEVLGALGERFVIHRRQRAWLWRR